MFKAFYSALLAFSILNAATPTPERIDDLEYPAIVSERAGVYRFKLSALIAANVLDTLSDIPPSHPYASPPAEEFRNLLLSFIYPHPSKVSGIKSLWSGFRETIIDLRAALGISEEGLPFFTMSQYEKLSTYQDALAAFKTHIENSIAKTNLTLEAEDINLLISGQLDQIQVKTKKLLDSYAAFYNSRQTPFRNHDIERYVISLLCITSHAPISPQSLAILEALQKKGCLELFGSLADSKFTYSPKAMAREYIATKGVPSIIILGCGHADSREMLETLRLPTETWCGACQKLPHAGAMVVSLDEPSADILSDLNHPDLWAQIKAGSVSRVEDETGSLSCYTPETLDSIVRVLKIGGAFHSNGYTDGCAITEALIARGFQIVEKNLDTRTVKLRKIR